MLLESTISVSNSKMDCQDRLLEENQARKAVSDAALSNEISTLNRTIESLRSLLDDEKMKHGALQLLHQKMCTDRCELEEKISGLSTRGARLEADLKHSLANSEGMLLEALLSLYICIYIYMYAYVPFTLALFDVLFFPTVTRLALVPCFLYYLI